MRPVFILSYLLLAMLPQLALADAVPRLINVSGDCQKSLVPDEASLTMTAQAMHPKDIRQALAEATRAYEQLRAKILALKLKDAELTTAEYSVQPVYDWANNKQTLRGYQARLGLRVATTEIDRMGDVIALAANAGMQDVGQWQLGIRPQKFREAQKSCLAEAVLDARNNAERMAQAAGAKLGAVQSLSQQGGYAPQPMPMVRAMKAEISMADGAPSPSIEAGKQDIQITVQASFSLE
jgi:uncharacterized protein